MLGYVSKVELLPSRIGVLSRWLTLSLERHDEEQELRCPDIERDVEVGTSVSVRVEFKPLKTVAVDSP